MEEKEKNARAITAEELARLLKAELEGEDDEGYGAEDAFLFGRFLRAVAGKVREVEARVADELSEEDERIKDEFRKIPRLFKGGKG